jgi:hypothetical protein
MKLPFEVACLYDENDTVQVDLAVSDSEVIVFGPGGSVYLTPKKARKLAKALKAAARQAEER